jgi:hypothetical protein
LVRLDDFRLEADNLPVGVAPGVVLEVEFPIRSTDAPRMDATFNFVRGVVSRRLRSRSEDDNAGRERASPRTKPNGSQDKVLIVAGGRRSIRYSLVNGYRNGLEKRSFLVGGAATRVVPMSHDDGAAKPWWKEGDALASAR